jgi:hypothetical protein
MKIQDKLTRRDYFILRSINTMLEADYGLHVFPINSGVSDITVRIKSGNRYLDYLPDIALLRQINAPIENIATGEVKKILEKFFG